MSLHFANSVDSLINRESAELACGRRTALQQWYQEAVNLRTGRVTRWNLSRDLRLSVLSAVTNSGVNLKNSRRSMPGSPGPLFLQKILKGRIGVGGFGTFRLFICLVLLESFCLLPLSLSQLASIDSI